MSGYLTSLFVFCTTCGFSPPSRRLQWFLITLVIRKALARPCPHLWAHPAQARARCACMNMAPGLTAHTVSFCPLNTRRPPITELRPPRWRRGHCGSSVLAELQCGTRWLLTLRQRGAPALLYSRRFYEYMYEHRHERKLGRGRH